MRVRLRAAFALGLPVACVAAFLACSQQREHPPLAPGGNPADAFNLEAFKPFGDVDPRDMRFDADGDAAPDAADARADADGAIDPDALDATDAAPDVAVDADAADGADARTVVVNVCEPALTTTTSTTCGVTVQSWKIEGADEAGVVYHVGFDTDVVYCTKPPHSGPHYGVWPAFRSYTTPVPKENLVHALEHGAVIVLYRCTTGDGCPSVAASLQAVIDARPIDPACDVTVKRRVILAPDPTLDVAVGAGAWGWTYRATCVDASTLGAFIDAHYGHGPEDFCADGCAGPFPTCVP